MQDEKDATAARVQAQIRYVLRVGNTLCPFAEQTANAAVLPQRASELAVCCALQTQRTWRAICYAYATRCPATPSTALLVLTDATTRSVLRAASKRSGRKFCRRSTRTT
eukprot:2249951-Rhodomonas_salina.5